MKKRFVLMLLFLIAAFNITTVANAFVQSSEYIHNCYANLQQSGNRVTVTFEITGKDTMDLIGAKTIIIQEKAPGSTSWSAVATYSYNNYSNMLSSNVSYYKSTVNYYNAKSDCEYRAKVYFYAEKGGYDTEEFITN